MRKLLKCNVFFITLVCCSGSALVLDAQTTPYTTIDFPGATTTSAWGISDRGDVVGVYSLPDKTNHGFLWSGWRLTSIDYPGATATDTWGINAQGDIAGDYTVNGG